jgi:pimeloyl-ACP methyl ester carboxylesterase
MERIEVDGLEIAYRRAGEGPPLVLLHGGLGLDSREWRRQLRGLSDEFTVVAWDMPGCGGSEDPPEDFRTRDYADCLSSFISGLALERPTILGLSLGSLVALELYRRHPDLPRSLILASAYAGWVGSLSPKEAEERRRRVTQMIEGPAAQWAQAWLPTLLTEQAPPEVVGEVRSIILEFHPEGQRALIHSGFAEIDLREVLPGIDVPTLLLYGEGDVRAPREVAEDMHARIPGSRMVFIPGAGHLCDMEAPEAFNAEVRRFLRPVSP